MNYQNIMSKIITRFKDSTLNKTTELNIDERFTDLVKRFYTSYSRKLIPIQFYQDNTSVDWSCYECKTAIIVNISKILNNGNFQASTLFCEKHKPTNYKIYDSTMFIRHETVFYNYIKQSILKSSPLLTQELTNENS